VHGQVFIVTKSRENVKLGLVTVALFPEAAVKKHIAVRTADAKPQRDSLETKISNLEGSLTKAQVQLSEVERGENAIQERQRRIVESQRAAPAMSRAWEDGYAALDAAEAQSKRIGTVAAHWKSEVLALTSELNSVYAQVKALNSTKYYLSGFPPAIAHTQTDADGEFSIRVPRNGHFVLAALAQRQVFDEMEEYAWVVSIAPDVLSGSKLLLSNETLTTGGSTISLVHTDD
jgi:hypothetical protein